MNRVKQNHIKFSNLITVFVDGLRSNGKMMSNVGIICRDERKTIFLKIVLF
mgnify:CR=1 FL=1